MTDRQTDRQTDSHNWLIDIFRILAIWMVLSVHIRSYLSDLPDYIDKLFGLGAYGVALYFIISGFLSVLSVSKEASFNTYIKKKSIRILPMYYISLFFTFVLGTFVVHIYPLDWKWIYHLFFLNMSIPAGEWMWWNSTNFFWTMPAFVAWYLISYPIIKRFHNIRGIAIILMISVTIVPFLKKIILSFSNQQFTNWNFFCLIYVFFFGVLANQIIKEKKFIYGIILGLILGFVGWLIGNRSGFFIFGLIFYELIVVLSMVPLKWNRGSQKIISTLSKISYSVYLTHWFILIFLGQSFRLMPWFLSYGLFILMASLLGYVCYKFIEDPVSKYFLKLLN